MSPGLANDPDGSGGGDALYAFGFGLLEVGRWSPAADVFRAMMIACPTDERAWLALGKCHEELGQTAIAINLYALACTTVHLAVRARVALARALRAMDRDDEAEEAMDGAERAAEKRGDEDLVLLVSRERSAS